MCVPVYKTRLGGTRANTDQYQSVELGAVARNVHGDMVAAGQYSESERKSCAPSNQLQ